MQIRSRVAQQKTVCHSRTLVRNQGSKIGRVLRLGGADGVLCPASLSDYLFMGVCELTYAERVEKALF